MFNFIYWLLGYRDEDKPILCINSMSPTDRKINYVMVRIDPDDEELDRPLIKAHLTEEEIDTYIDNFY